MSLYRNNVIIEAPTLHDRTAPPNKDRVKSVIQYATNINQNISQKQLTCLILPNSPVQLLASSWMERFFELVGDKIPNSNGEIHLEPITIKEIWEEYMVDMQYYNLSTVGLTTFDQIWLSSFTHVKIREFKAVTGKCETCALLSLLRKSFRQPHLREEVTNLHYIHRITYMGERKAYADRTMQGMISLISDGMAQNHCKMPWKANLKDGDCLTQHLQGILIHGAYILIFRTFHNILCGSNLAIHCFLLSLEKYKN